MDHNLVLFDGFPTLAFGLCAFNKTSKAKWPCP